jgi:hypothetical protein
METLGGPVELSNLRDGFILVSRSLLDSEVFKNPLRLKVWIWCLLKAAHQDGHVSVRTGRGETVVEIKRGQFIFGRLTASRDLGIPRSSIRNIIGFLERCGNLTLKKDSHYSIVTVRNYDIYQRIENYYGTGKRTGKGQAKDTNKEAEEEAKERSSPEGDLPLSPQPDTKKEDSPPKGGGSTRPRIRIIRRPKSSDPRIKEVIDFFHDFVLQKWGFKPAINGGKDGDAVKRALSGGEMSLEDVKGCLTWYLSTSKANEHLTLSAALSAHSLNAFRGQEAGNGGGRDAAGRELKEL